MYYILLYYYDLLCTCVCKPLCGEAITCQPLGSSTLVAHDKVAQTQEQTMLLSAIFHHLRDKPLQTTFVR